MILLKKYNDLVANLVRKFGKFDDSAHLMWMYEYRKEQSATHKALMPRYSLTRYFHRIVRHSLLLDTPESPEPTTTEPTQAPTQPFEAMIENPTNRTIATAALALYTSALADA